jgi:hypothetical protein
VFTTSRVTGADRGFAGGASRFSAAEAITSSPGARRIGDLTGFADALRAVVEKPR